MTSQMMIATMNNMSLKLFDIVCNFCIHNYAVFLNPGKNLLNFIYFLIILILVPADAWKYI